jgi:hypothetical protein
MAYGLHTGRPAGLSRQQILGRAQAETQLWEEEREHEARRHPSSVRSMLIFLTIVILAFLCGYILARRYGPPAPSASPSPKVHETFKP